MTRVQWQAHVVPGGAIVDVIADDDSTTPVLSIESPSDLPGGAEAPLALTGTDPAEVVAALTAAPGQDGALDADLFQVQNTAGDSVFNVNAQGTTQLHARSANDVLQVRRVAGGAIMVEIFSDGSIYLASDSATSPALFIEPLDAPNATVAILDVSGTVTNTRVLRTGHLALVGGALPADAELRNQDCAFAFDATNGASKIKFKGKSANGTIVVGEIALT